MQKWGYLLESDKDSRLLYQKWQQSQSSADQQAWLRYERRSGQDVATVLKDNAPPIRDVEDVKDEVTEGAARGLFLFAWADREEQHGTNLGGGEIDDMAPATPRRATRSGAALIKSIERLNRLSINQLYWVAQNMPGRHHRHPEPELFGHYLAAEALGHGVAWSDNHPDPDIKLPHWDFQYE